MTVISYTQTIRRAALQESKALRGWAKVGVTPPPCTPIDRWDEWRRAAHTSSTSYQKEAA